MAVPSGIAKLYSLPKMSLLMVTPVVIGEKVTENHRINNYGATYEIAKTIKMAAELLKTIPTFTGGNDAHYFKRLNPENCTFTKIMSGYYSRPSWLHAYR